LFKNAKIGAHKDDAKAIESADSNESMSHMFAAKMEPKKLDFRLDDGDILKAGDMKLKVIHARGIQREASACMTKRTKSYFPAMWFLQKDSEGLICPAEARAR